MGAAGAGGQQRADRRAAGDRRAARRLHPAAHARARRGLLDRRGPLGRDRGPAARRHPRRAAPGRLAAAVLPAAAPLAGVAGRSEESVHGLSVLFAALCVPAAFWAGWTLFGRRAGWIAALLAAVNPFLTQYAQEGRMYALVALLGTAEHDVLAAGVRARRRRRRCGQDPPRAADRLRGRVLGDALHAQLGAVLRRGDRDRLARAAVAGARPAERRRLLRTGLLAYGGVLLLYAPWIPTRSTRPPTRARRGPSRRRSPRSRPCPRASSARSPRSRCSSPRARGVVALLRVARRRARARCAALLLIAVLTIVLAWIASQLSPALGQPLPRRRRRAVPAAAAAGFAHAGRLGLVGLALVAVLWAIDGAPDGEEQRPRRGRVDRPLAAARRPRRRDAARADPGARTTTCPTGCATRRSPGRCRTPA